MNKVSLEHQGVALEPSAAGAILTIDLEAVRENYRRLRAKAGAARCAGVVKADGYGLGAVPVALALLAEGCDTFFVAHVGEGISLREVIGPKPTI
jgi:alanine racemase